MHNVNQKTTTAFYAFHIEPCCVLPSSDVCSLCRWGSSRTENSIWCVWPRRCIASPRQMRDGNPWLLLVRHTSTCWLCSSTMWFWWPALWKQVVVLFGGSSRSSRMRNSGHLRRRPTTLMDHCLPPCFCISPPHAHCLSSIAFLTHKCGDL